MFKKGDLVEIVDGASQWCGSLCTVKSVSDDNKYVYLTELPYEFEANQLEVVNTDVEGV